MRDEYGTSLALLSKASGVPLTTLTNLDLGTTSIANANFMTVARLARALRVKPEDLLESAEREELKSIKRAKKRLRALPKPKN